MTVKEHSTRKRKKQLDQHIEQILYFELLKGDGDVD